MSKDDRNYYRLRAEQELKAVEEAHGPAAANAHKLLAARYSLLAEQGLAMSPPEDPSVATPK